MNYNMKCKIKQFLKKHYKIISYAIVCPLMFMYGWSLSTVAYKLYVEGKMNFIFSVINGGVA